MKLAVLILGILFILVGGVWVLQGTNVLTQGAMAGHMRWTGIGAVLGAAGIVLVVVAARIRPTRHTWAPLVPNDSVLMECRPSLG